MRKETQKVSSHLSEGETFCLTRHKVLYYSNISGLNQLLWYYADLEKKKCLDDMYSRRDTLEGLMHGRRSNKVNNVTARRQMAIIISLLYPTCFSDLGAGDGERVQKCTFEPQTK